MPVKLLSHLRLLNPLTRFASMKSDPRFKRSSRVVPILSRIFPHRLKYQSLSTKLGFPNSPTRLFSTRLGSQSEVRASKSLIDDEAELSDWVSGLRSDSFRTRLYSSDDDKSGNENRDGDRRRGNNERGRFSPGKRRRDSDSDSYSSMSRQRDSDSFGSFSRNSRGKSRFGGELEGKKDGYSSSNRQMDRDSFGSFSRNSRFDGELEGKNEGFVSRRRDNYFRGEKRPIMSERGGRVSEFGYGRDRGGGGLKKGGKDLRRGGEVISEEESGDDVEEEEDKRSMKSFRDLISEEDSEGEDDDDDDDDVLKNASGLFPAKKEANPWVVPSSPGRSDSYLSETRFDQCSVSSSSLKGIKDAGYEMMTVVQNATLPVILKGKDVLAKAKTGTGKTVAFLLPSIEVVLKSIPIDRNQKRSPIFVLVICPTRELASQAAAEANTLLKYHPSIGVQVVIGGTRLALEQKRMQANPCQILVATPGRLKDHIENTAGFATQLMGVKVLVLDEADHLLDMGFRRDIEHIIAAVPKQRQTLLFSATVPEEVRRICHIALKRDHEFIDTVGQGTEETHSQVRQMHLVAPLDKHFSLLYSLLKEHISDDVDYKVLVFCTTAMVTRLVADLLGKINLNVREIHSRKPQSYRTRISDEFRKSKGLILVTSDVSARGVDYPDVTLVIQVGLPADRQQYIHRLGRTGRKGKEGQGILLLAPWEEFFLSSIKDLPITKASVPSVDPEMRKKVEQGLSHVEMKNKAAAYQAWLGYYNSSKVVGRDKYKLVELANEFSQSMGLDNPPAIPKLVLGKMGLKNIPGLRSK
ncbi:DEAD-box ATP-dependent RNA helicase 31-like isoform X1 [Actinidia eriantha]|uniref:DEAD-box ATP-dependent RNA helicase 31-like isoform X1 n=1 Tax=Actinidia eriantha TaxID=165200 RepID=UPI002589C969|nr:DEAD-box ATP-dependent RNA helicase 31-like isoform X1 [Actinidia eriantha]